MSDISEFDDEDELPVPLDQSLGVQRNARDGIDGVVEPRGPPYLIEEPAQVLAAHFVCDREEILGCRMAEGVAIEESVQDALDILKFTRKRAATMIDKVLKSAVADADEQQADVDNFQLVFPGCTELIGSVTISGSDITNLLGLDNVTSIAGSLWINNNDSLTSMTGLEGLTSIGDYIYIFMEKCDCTLEEFLRDEKPPSGVVRKLLYQIAEGMPVEG